MMQLFFSVYSLQISHSLWPSRILEYVQSMDVDRDSRNFDNPFYIFILKNIYEGTVVISSMVHFVHFVIFLYKFYCNNCKKNPENNFIQSVSALKKHLGYSSPATRKASYYNSLNLYGFCEWGKSLNVTF